MAEDSDDYFYYIVGYTSGGTAYELLGKKWELIQNYPMK